MSQALVRCYFDIFLILDLRHGKPGIFGGIRGHSCAKTHQLLRPQGWPMSDYSDHHSSLVMVIRPIPIIFLEANGGALCRPEA